MPTINQEVETSYSLRPAQAADDAFLLELYAQERKTELMLAGLDPMQRDVFVRMQFRARQASYSASFPSASSEIICAEDGSPIGRFLVDRTQGAIRIVDIALAVHSQHKGVGTSLIRELQQECRTLGCKLKLQVLKESAAVRLYLRLGFEIEGEDLMRWQMVWNRTRN